MIVSLK